MELFDKVLHDLKEFPDKIKALHFYKDGEPLLHKNFCEMYAKLKSAGITEKIWVKSNGLLLNPELNRKLIASGLEWLGISVEALNSERYFQLTSARIDYEKFLKNLSDLYNHRGNCEIYAKIIDVGLTAADKQQFIHDFSPISDHCAIEELMGWSYSDSMDFTLGTNPKTAGGLLKQEKVACPFPFYSLAINSDGTVSICCVDWAHQTIVGNLYENSLKEIWEGEALYHFRLMHLKGERCRNLACGQCYHLTTLPDSVDENRSRIITSLQKTRK